MNSISAPGKSAESLSRYARARSNGRPLNKAECGPTVILPILAVDGDLRRPGVEATAFGDPVAESPPCTEQSLMRHLGVRTAVPFTRRYQSLISEICDKLPLGVGNVVAVEVERTACRRSLLWDVGQSNAEQASDVGQLGAMVGDELLGAFAEFAGDIDSLGGWHAPGERAVATLLHLLSQLIHCIGQQWQAA